MNVEPIVSTECSHAALATLAPLFEYPGPEYREHLDAARAAVAEIAGGAADGLERFQREIADLDRGGLESIYTTTFDLGPSCLPYLGAHLFEPESRDRARLMVGLRMTYRKGGYEIGTELPDHVAEVLRFAPNYEEQDWSDLLDLVLVPALAKMEHALEDSSNPYRHLISAAGHLCRAASVEGGES